MIMFGNIRNGLMKLEDTQMSYASFGHGKEVLIVLPGLSDGLATVRGKALLLAAPYRQYFDRYTVYMFSRKDSMATGYSIRQMADDQARVLAALNLSRVSVLGVSEGGMIAQCLAVDHPELVEKLVIAVSAPNANALAKECVSRWIGYARSNDHKQLMIDTAERSYSEKYLNKYRTAYPLLGLIGKPRSYERFLINAEAILSFDLSGELDKITCPTLIIGGAKDKIVGVEASCRLQKLIAGSTLHVYEGLGHALYEEAEDFYRRVFGFLDSVSAR